MATVISGQKGKYLKLCNSIIHRMMLQPSSYLYFTTDIQQGYLIHNAFPAKISNTTIIYI